MNKGAETFDNFGDGGTAGQAVLDNPRLFVFILGGLSHHEMCSISELQKTLPAQIVPGSNEIINA
jgi:hypothetical protein